MRMVSGAGGSFVFKRGYTSWLETRCDRSAVRRRRGSTSQMTFVFGELPGGANTQVPLTMVFPVGVDSDYHSTHGRVDGRPSL